MRKRTLDEYLKLPYTIEVIRETDPDDPGWVARVVELPGCITQGDNFEELGEMIEDAMRAWIEAALEGGQEIPEPRTAEEYSGKFVVRVPKSLHRRLVQTAEREGVSLNQFINVALTDAVRISSPEMAKSLQVSRDDIHNWIKEAVHGIYAGKKQAPVSKSVPEERLSWPGPRGENLKAVVIEKVESDLMLNQPESQAKERWLYSRLKSQVLDDL